MTQQVPLRYSASIMSKAKNAGRDPMQELARWAMERAMVRITPYEEVEGFLSVLKGGTRLNWDLSGPFKDNFRVTSDLDINVEVTKEAVQDAAEMIEAVLRNAFENDQVLREEDGFSFKITRSVPLEHAHQDEHGRKFKIAAQICGKGRINFDMDFSFSKHQPEHTVVQDIPTMIPGMTTGKVRMQSLSLVLSEKLHGMVQHGMTNTRAKDFRDAYLFATHLASHSYTGTAHTSDASKFEAENVAAIKEAVAYTFAKRDTDLVTGTPPGMSDAYAEQMQDAWVRWRAKYRQEAVTPEDFKEVVATIRRAFLPMMSKVQPSIDNTLETQTRKFG